MYKKILLITVPIVLLILLIGGWYFFIRNTKGAFLIETSPVSRVYIDGAEVGLTPYEGAMPAKEITIKLVPEAFDKPMVPYETRVLLTPGVKTIVRRKFGEEEQLSSSEIISFERRPKEKGTISIVTLPDAAEVFIDGQRFDTTPAKISGISAGSHQVAIRAQGYQETTFPVQVTAGYGMTIVAHLSKDPAFTPPQQTPLENVVTEKKQVKILDTPTGFLRVRSEPSPTSDEVGRVTPEKEYQLIEEDSTKKWYKIPFEEGKEGWISVQYATISATLAQ